jgi:hypothetical protein
VARAREKQRSSAVGDLKHKVVQLKKALFLSQQRERGLSDDLDATALQLLRLQSGSALAEGPTGNGLERFGGVRFCARPACFETVESTRRDAKFCSTKCRMANRDRRKRDRLVRVRVVHGRAKSNQLDTAGPPCVRGE